MAAAIVLPAGPTAAAADGSNEFSARTYMLAPGAATPSLAQLKAGTGQVQLAVAGAPENAATTPMEVVGPAAAYGKRASTPAAVASPRQAAPLPFMAPAVSYPEPARALTLDECKQNLAGATQVYIKSRFAVCTGLKVTTVWEKQSGAVGTSTYTVYVRGTVPKEADRTMYFDYDVTDFTAVGSTGVSGLKIGLKGDIAADWPAAATPITSNTLPVTKTWLEMQSHPHYTHSVRYAPGQGTGAGAADVIAAVYQPEVTSTLPAGWVGESPKTGKPFMFAPRWDAASYLRNSTGAGNPANKGGAAFSMIATLEYSSKPGAPEQAVAEHIRQAFTNPKATKPLNALKNVPGDTIQEPLHRLFLDTKRHDRNRAVAVRECKRYWGANYTDGGKECDEFPFASTYEGSAVEEYDVNVERNNFSVQPVPGDQNGAAGTLLRGFYNANRIIDGPEDGFIVKIN
ncbi:NucA/NucB deoxyribonuclease domain-containing protein [Streptomyces sp. NPDC127106]|uniref:NucA/NucB deoxyribonuclease domain-containing protein n=1 Tax=Streptomyces sp. NPDC127106 TaxID=3345360 RepID=UPI003625AA6C